MNKKTLLAVLLTVCLMLTLCACTGGNKPEPADPTTTAPTTTTTTAPAIPTPGEGQVLYAIKVVDSNGNPVVGEYVQMCLETCVFQATNNEGIAYFACAEADYKVTIMNAITPTEYHFEAGSHEMTIVYDAAESNTNDVVLDW